MKRVAVCSCFTIFEMSRFFFKMNRPLYYFDCVDTFLVLNHKPNQIIMVLGQDIHSSTNMLFKKQKASHVKVDRICLIPVGTLKIIIHLISLPDLQNITCILLRNFSIISMHHYFFINYF